jgi:hypothetical protein
MSTFAEASVEGTMNKIAEPVLASARVLLRHEPDPC